MIIIKGVFWEQTLIKSTKEEPPLPLTLDQHITNKDITNHLFGFFLHSILILKKLTFRNVEFFFFDNNVVFVLYVLIKLAPNKWDFNGGGASQHESRSTK